MSKHGNVRVRKNSGAIVGTRRLLNLIEGANVTLTIADDGPGDEIDITIAAAGALATAWVAQFFPAPDPDGNKGTYASVVLHDEYDVTVRQTFIIPAAIDTIDRAVVIVIPDASGNLRRGVDTNFGEVCANEDYQTNVDTIAAGQVTVSADEIECIDISVALTGAVGGDLVGMEFTRYASNINDDIDDDVHYIGVLIEGSV